MTIFAILLPAPNAELMVAIEAAFRGNFFGLNDLHCLVSSTGTAVDVTARAGIYDPQDPDKLSKGSAIVFATSSYFGRAPTPVWDWMRAKLEPPEVKSVG